MKSNYETVRQGTKRLPCSLLVAKVRNIIHLMTGNPAFPDPQPSLAEVAEACDELDVANRVASFNCGRCDIVARDSAQRHLRNILLQLGGYVQMMTHGDGALILSAGFDVKKKVQPSVPMPAPRTVVAKSTAYPGRLIVRWSAVKGRKWYGLQMCPADGPAAWKEVIQTGNVQVTLNGLMSDHTYQFRVVAYGALGASPLSDVAMAKAA
jgi:hypothetical protein